MPVLSTSKGVRGQARFRLPPRPAARKGDEVYERLVEGDTFQRPASPGKPRGTVNLVNIPSGRIQQPRRRSRLLARGRTRVEG